jgi:hypothetical protein
MFAKSRRSRRTLVAVTALLVTGGFAAANMKPSTKGLTTQDISVEATPIAAFDKSDASQTRFGSLEWRGGLVLTSNAANFGGWSGLAVDDGGKRLIAVSDGGTWLTANLTYEGSKPSALAGARIGAITARDGSNLRKTRDRDAEAVTLVSGTLLKGSLLVSFEQNDRIGRFSIAQDGLSVPSGYVPLPLEAKRLRLDGFEAMTVLQGGPNKGSLIAFAEHQLKGEKSFAGWIWIAGKPARLSMTDIGGFGVTDAASLADGGLIILERRFRWLEGVRMRLRRIAAADVKPGAVLQGEILLEADLGQEIDNMEGVAVHTGPGGETLLTLISDDNFNRLLQRTVLLQFALPSAVQALRK